MSAALGTTDAREPPGAAPRPVAPPIRSAETRFAYERTIDCVHCGLCLPKCPTYLLTGRETSSPRGRLYLARAFAEGRVEATERFVEEMNFCLVCRACEPVCPAGVRFGEMMESARAEISRHERRGPLQALGRFLLFRRALVRPGWRNAGLGMLRLYGRPFVRALVRPLLPRRLRARDALLPVVPARRDRVTIPDVTSPTGALRGRVHALRGCVMEPLLPEATRATVAVLVRNGFEVVAPREPLCCGALHAHFGELELARSLARGTVASFEESGAQWVVVNSAGCGAAMKDYGRLLGGDPEWRGRAEAFSKRVRDFSEFLVEVGFERPGRSLRARVAYADACHLLHGQRISQEPRSLLRAVAGVQLVPLPESDLCCGAAGIYSLTNFEASLALLDRKMAAIRAARPDVVVSGNPGCLLHYRAGARRAALRVQVLHTAEVLERAYAGR